MLIYLPIFLSKLCIKRLEKYGLATIICNECNKLVSFKINLDYVHSRKHILPWNYGNDKMSPCEIRTFNACNSMHNIQRLSISGRSWKYCCKYVGKIKKNNYRKVSTSADGSLIRRAFFCTIPNVLLLINSNNQNKRRNETVNTRKGQLSVTMKSGTTFWIIHKLSLIYIFLWSKKLRWKQ